MDYDAACEKLEKIKRTEARKAKVKSDASNVTKWLYFVSLAHAFLILLPIFGDSWIAAQFNGFGVSMVTLRTSLFMIDVKVDCEKNYFEDKICDRLKKFEGRRPLTRARDTFCSIPGSGAACQMVQEVCKTSFIIFVFFILAAGFHMFSSSFLYYYWEKTPLPQARRFAHLFYFLGPITSAFGLALWTVSTPNLSEMARSWTSTADTMTAGLPIFSFQAVGDCPYGWCWFYSLVLCAIAILTMLIWPMFFVEHEMEDLAKEEELRHMDAAQNYGLYGVDHDYGSMAQGQLGSSFGHYGAGHVGTTGMPQADASLAGQSSFAQQQNQFHYNP